MTSDFEQRFLKARRAVIARRFSALNDMQQKAVLTTEGPLLLLAGAGSGKTTVMIEKIVRLILNGADVSEILAVFLPSSKSFIKPFATHC